MNTAQFTARATMEKAIEDSTAAAVAEIMAVGFEGFTDGGYTVTRAEGSHNVVTIGKDRDGNRIELQLIVKVGTPHELRDDLWDAIMDAQDMDTGPTQYANAVMERLGFPRPEGGWPK